MEPAPASEVTDDFAVGEQAAVYQFVEQWRVFRDLLQGQRHVPCLDELVPYTEKQRMERCGSRATVARFVPRSFARRCAQVFSQFGPVWCSITVAVW